ncbi:MAG: N-acetylmuramoyl-L-alanine amidase [Actinomycetota bacterium]
MRRLTSAMVVLLLMATPVVAKADTSMRNVRRAQRPPIRRDSIPYGRKRKREMAGYSKRHYGHARWTLKHIHVIVLHFTGGNSYSFAWNTFASDSRDLGELPGVCAHFIVGKDGVIHQLVPTTIRCRHAIGLNHVAVGIEMVQPTGQGAHWADRQILKRHPQIRSALRLVRFLRSKYRVKMKNVIGHSMANDSPYFKDKEGWRNTHTDWLRQDVHEFRRRLRRLS